MTAENWFLVSKLKWLICTQLNSLKYLPCNPIIFKLTKNVLQCRLLEKKNYGQNSVLHFNSLFVPEKDAQIEIPAISAGRLSCPRVKFPGLSFSGEALQATWSYNPQEWSSHFSRAAVTMTGSTIQFFTSGMDNRAFELSELIRDPNRQVIFCHLYLF